MSTNWEPPNAFDDYIIVKTLGKGAMGHVYLARDIPLDRHVAIKFIREVDPDDEMLKMFKQEAQVLARMAHPNVVTVHRLGELEGKPYLVSEYVDGEGLESKPKPMPWKEVLKLGIDLARGLGAVHKQNVLHRDVKPANAMIAKNGAVKLLDFGIAKIVDAVRHAEYSAEADAGGQAPAIQPAMHGIAANRTETSPQMVVSPALRTDISPSDINRTLVSGDATTPRAPSRAFPSMDATPISQMRGTPFYMAPELWRGFKASPRSDIYSLGVLLYELCTGRTPHAKNSLHELVSAVLHADVPSLNKEVDDIHHEFASIVHRCLERDPKVRYASATELALELDDLRQRLDVAAHEPMLIPSMRALGNPYRGLLPFEASHQQIFFGRETEVGAIIERLKRQNLLIVAGDSGVGKSSLCKAGVLPALPGQLEGKKAWITASLVPGKNPIHSLFQALAPALNLNEHRLSFQLYKDPDLVVREIQNKLGDNTGLILFIDQLEELVTISQPDEAKMAEAFLAQVLERVPGVRLLGTLRADFLGKIAGMTQIGRVLPRALFFPRKMTSAQIREAIVGPARIFNVKFEPEELIESLVAYTAHAECGLPLLQFALKELWDARTPGGSIITQEALRQIGGVGGALARHADQVLLSLPESAKASARRMLTSLVAPEGTRARCAKKDLLWNDIHAGAALKTLEDARLVVPLTTAESSIEYQLAHDVLIKEWETLQGWLADRIKSRAVRENIRKDAMEWERLQKENDVQRARELLWRTRRLAEAAAIDGAQLSQVERSFLTASRNAERKGRAVRWALLAGIPMALLLTYGVSELNARRGQERARERIAREIDARITESRSILAEAEQQRQVFLSSAQDAVKAFHSNFAAGESAWEGVREKAQAADLRYGKAIQKLEEAFLKDASRKDLKKALSEAYLQRILFAEQSDQNAQPWIERLALYDETGESRAKLSAPGHLHLKLEPEGAELSIERYAESTEGTLRAENSRVFGGNGLSDIELAEGSYRLIIKGGGPSTIYYPLMVRRGEDIHLDIHAPAQADIPKGFLFIPKGRFLFGAAAMNAADDRFRRVFLATLPEHETQTEAYLIAENETTYQDWIEYLDDLPASKRDEWNQRGIQSGVRGSVGLTPSKDGVWELAFSVNGAQYRARAGEPICYPGRRSRTEQSWLRFPVMGISARDAEAYTQWLRTTGRVRGARLCTEKEWERAARGADRRLYAHGNNVEGDEANFQDTYLGSDDRDTHMGPDEVGAHPLSDSPFGAHDMVGNVFEWVSSSLPDHSHVLKGGGYIFDKASLLSVNRNTADPNLSDPNGGLRVCATYPSP